MAKNPLKAKKSAKAAAPSKIAVKTRTHSDLNSMKEAVKSKGPMTRLSFKDGQTRTVRFLHEPFEKKNPWIEFEQHSISTANGWRTVPCIEGCKLDGEVRAQTRWYVNVWDRESKSVKLLVLTQAMAENLMIKFEKRKTLMERDYSITRVGEGTETKYHIEPEDKEAFKLPSNAKLIDIMGELERQVKEYFGGGTSLKPKASKLDEDDDEEDEDDEEEDTDDEEEDDDEDDEEDDEEEDDDDSDDDDEDEEEDEEDEDEDEDDDDEDDEDDSDDDDDDDEDEPPAKKAGKAKAGKSVAKKPVKRPVGKKGKK